MTRIWAIKLLCLFIILLLNSFTYSQDEYIELSSWEIEDIKPVYSSFDSTEKFVVKSSILCAKMLIGFYQNNISTRSIDRCPFYISCSHYAYIAISKYGLFPGICFFIDRNFYRENITSFYYYELRENDDGILKLDDSFYILGKDY
jgi:hypothetical protein